MNIFILAVGGTAMLAGIAKISLKRLAVYSALTPVVFGTCLLLTSWTLTQLVNTEYKMDEVVAQMSSASELPEQVRDYSWSQGETSGPRSLAEITKSGVLRVGYNPLQVPFSHYNIHNELVGFDIEMMKKLAAELNVEIEFVPYTLHTALGSLESGQFDVAVSGIQMTTTRIQYLGFTDPVLTLHYTLVIKDHRKDEFEDHALMQKTPLRIASVGSYTIIPQLQQKYPHWQFDTIDSDKQFFEDDGKTWDALIISLEAGKTWTILYPQYSTSYNRDEIRSFPASYVVALENQELRSFLNSWLVLQKSSGYTEKLYRYWILGENAKPKKARWSVIKDVLELVDEP